jgi:AraC-like DNA-binding protein
MCSFEESTTIELSATSNYDFINRIILENMLTLMGREINVIAGEYSNLKIFSPFHTPTYPEPWEKGELFKLTFSKTILKAAIKDNSHWGFEILIPEYLKIMESLRPDQSFSNKVKLVALNQAKPSLPDLELVADTFNLTSRTLQRRLLAEGVTFRQITEELKQNICNLLIRHDRFSINDLSHVLGYSESAAFIHSFKKWYGVSPQAYKESILI